jgi:alanyl-tRNA synthetase
MDYTAAEALQACGEINGKKCVMYPLKGDAKEAKQLINRLTAAGEVMAGVFYADSDRVGYLIAKTKGIKVSCREVASIANGLLNGKGGGSDTFAQGSGKYSNDWRELVQMVESAVLRMM